jgi:Uri superfamily endonuclease
VACTERLEHAWVRALSATPEVQLTMPGFGASDSPCRSHLFFSARRPPSQTLTDALLAGIENVSPPTPRLTIEIHTFSDL